MYPLCKVSLSAQLDWHGEQRGDDVASVLDQCTQFVMWKFVDVDAEEAEGESTRDIYAMKWAPRNEK